jgi:quercetin 2,3-dioxygenase
MNATLRTLTGSRPTGCSFSEYYDPENIQFGALRVFNDDVVAPHTGFGTHPHEEMEIITIVLDGEVTHEDSLGTKAVMRAGDVQRMSAGTGIHHSEFNLGEVPAHFYQVWIYPDTSGLPPSYDQKSFAGTMWTNRLVPVASGQGLPDVVTFKGCVRDACNFSLLGQYPVKFTLLASKPLF